MSMSYFQSVRWLIFDCNANLLVVFYCGVFYLDIHSISLDNVIEEICMAIITLMTDFGIKDGNVGVMKGVIWNICPDAHIADLSHIVGAQNIPEAALVLARSAPYFPKNTVHVVVVDPGAPLPCPITPEGTAAGAGGIIIAVPVPPTGG